MGIVDVANKGKVSIENLRPLESSLHKTIRSSRVAAAEGISFFRSPQLIPVMRFIDQRRLSSF